MALTWQNVDAPNLNGAGAMIGQATSGINDALAGLRASADRASAKRREAYSAKALAGLAGVTDPNSVAAYLQTIDPSKATPEFMEAAMRQPGVLLDRAAKQVELRNAEGDLSHEQGTRAGALEAASAIINANKIAGTTGDVDKAYEGISGLTGYAAIAAQDAAAGLVGTAKEGLGYRDAMMDFNEKVENEELDDFTTDYFQNNLLINANSKDEARNKIITDNSLTAPQRERMLATVDKTEDSTYQFINPELEDRFAADPITQENAAQEAFVAEDIAMNLESTPASIYEENLAAIKAGVPSAAPKKGEGEAAEGDGKASPAGATDNIQLMGQKAGIDTEDYVFRNNMRTTLQNGIQEANKRLAAKGLGGVVIDEDEMTAAILSTAGTGNRAWYTLGITNGATDEGRVSFDRAVQMAVDMKDPEARKGVLAREQFFTNAQKTLSDKAANLEKLKKDLYITETKKGRGPEYDKKMKKVLDETKAFNAEFKKYHAGKVERGFAPSAEAQAAAQAEAAGIGSAAAATPPVPTAAGPAAPDAVIRAAMLKKAAERAEAARLLNPQVVDLVLPNGLTSREIPAIAGDGSVMQEINW